MLTTELAISIRRAVGFRNVLVYDYIEVDDSIVVDRLKSLDDRLHRGPPLHRHVRPPASYGMLCSKSAWTEGLRQVGPVQVAYRISDRCRSLTPGSCPLAWYRWSQSPMGIGSRVTIRSRCPGVPVCSRQAPYPPGGPCWPEAVKENPGPAPSRAPGGGSGPPRRPGLSGLSRRRAWLLGSALAQPCPMACPSLSVTVTHQVVLGFRAAAAARSRASHGSVSRVREAARTVRSGGDWKGSTRRRSRSEAARRGNPGGVAAAPHAGQRTARSPNPTEWAGLDISCASASRQ